MQHSIWMVLLFCAALTLRLWAVDNGLPQVQVPDESGDIATSLQLLSGQSPEYAYHRVGWPVSQMLVHGLHFLLHRLQDPTFDVGNFRALYFTDRASFILSARVWLAALASLCAPLLYVLGWWISRSRVPAVLMALLITVHPAHVYLSHYALPDAFATLWIALALCGCIVLAQNGSRWSAALAGFSAAVAMLARLQTAPILATIALAVLIDLYYRRRWRDTIVLSLICAGSFVVGSVMFNPIIVLDPAAIVADIQFIFDDRVAGASASGAAAQISRLQNMGNNLILPWQFVRPSLLLASIAASLLLLWRRRWAFLPLMLFCLAINLLVLSTFGPRITFWLPLVIPGIVLAGAGVAEAVQLMHHHRPALGWRMALLAAMLLLVLSLARESFVIDRVLAQPRTQQLAYEYIVQNVPADSRIVQGDPFIYTVPLQRNLNSLQRLEQSTTLAPSYQFQLAEPQTIVQPAYDLYTQEERSDIHSDQDFLEFLRRNQIGYVIETDYCQGQTTYDDASHITFPVITDAVRRQLRLLYVTSPFASDVCLQSIENRTHMEMMQLDDFERVGPIIRIYLTSSLTATDR